MSAKDRGFQRPSGAALVAKPEPLTTAEPAPAAATDTDLPMPPVRQREYRAQFNTKLLPGMIKRIRGFADHHDASIQDIVEQALDEYLTRRGWTDNHDK
jgi:hypothetical protein